MSNPKKQADETIYCENWICETEAITTRTRARSDGEGEVEINLCGCCAEAWDMALINLKVDVRGGVAYPFDNRIEVIDHD